MYIKQHKNSRTSLAVRNEIRSSRGSVNSLAVKFGLSWKTIKKWKDRNSPEDIASRPHKLRTSLTATQEDLILFERKQYKKTIEEIPFALEDVIPNLYPIKIYRVLARYGLSALPDELLKAERKIRRFRHYTIGYLHIDALYTSKIGRKRWYVFTCIDRVTKLAFVRLTDHKTKDNGAKFLRMVLAFYPYPIHYILTDNGFELTYKALVKSRRTRKIHPFDGICLKHKSNTGPSSSTWTNGMVERFNGKIKTKVFHRYLFANITELEEKLIEYVNRYNFEVRLKQLGYQTPADYPKSHHNYSAQRIVI